MENIRDYIKDNILLFDGGMGTYYAAKKNDVGRGCEFANISDAESIIDIHREYIEAGAKAIKTNTFGLNRVILAGDDEKCSELLRGGYENAKQAAGEDAFVFCDIGPIPEMDGNVVPADEYIWVADQFLSLGADAFLFETLDNMDGVAEVAAYIRSKRQDAFVIFSFAVMADGFTRAGVLASDIVEKLRTDKNIDSIGFNCACSAGHMLSVLDEVNTDGMILSVSPNAGYPVIIQNRSFYDGDPVYFAEQVSSLKAKGAAIVGGCCGTTPDHIRAVKNAVSVSKVIEKKTVHKLRDIATEEITQSLFWDKLLRKEKVIAVELDPPEGFNMSRFMGGAWELKGVGTDIITIADCPIGRPRMDSSLLACKIKRELGIDALPHMTCRDRNINSIKALLFGLYAEGIRNILLVTGDPIPTAERDEVKSVFQFNSRKLASFVDTLGKKKLPSPFHVFGALDVNARNFDVQLKLAREKVANGMVGFLTQPVLTPEAFENLKRAKAELDAFILGGIIPVVSEKNARFMDNEINGIRVDKKVIEMYVGKNRQESEELAVEISAEIAKRISDYVDGYYFMTPFGRTTLIKRIIEEVRG